MLTRTLAVSSWIRRAGTAGPDDLHRPHLRNPYGSNVAFPFIGRDVKNGKDEDLTQEPGSGQAFGDTCPFSRVTNREGDKTTRQAREPTSG